MKALAEEKPQAAAACVTVPPSARTRFARCSRSCARHAARLLSYSHATVDFYQGAIAALVPFLVLERGYTYTAAAGIVLAFSLSSSLIQPLFGALGDRWRMRWLIPVSIIITGAGIASIGFVTTFWVTATVAALSGAGVAAFHPAAASRAREIGRFHTPAPSPRARRVAAVADAMTGVPSPACPWRSSAGRSCS